jgi:hypothetical protein
MPDILNRVGTALSKSSVISDEYSTQVSCCSINHTHTHTITLSHTHRVNQDEMLASVRDKRLQFEDTTKMTEITTLVSPIFNLLQWNPSLIRTPIGQNERGCIRGVSLSFQRLIKLHARTYD